MDVWTQTRYLKKTMNWGEPEKMNGGLILSFDLIRHYMDVPFYVHKNGGYAITGHSDGSQHYKGNAVDGDFVGMSFKDACKKLIQTLDYLQLTNFVGLGYYPEWNTPGFHIDLRGWKARWAWVGGKQIGVDGIEWKQDD